MSENEGALNELLGLLFQAHPWHGVSRDRMRPRRQRLHRDRADRRRQVRAGQGSGQLRVDRPQRFSVVARRSTASSRKPSAATSWASSAPSAPGDRGIKGDGDPMDICVLTEKPFAHGDFLVRAGPSAACA